MCKRLKYYVVNCLKKRSLVHGVFFIITTYLFINIKFIMMKTIVITYFCKKKVDILFINLSIE